MPIRMMDLAKHKGPEDFKAIVRGITKKSLPTVKVMGSDVLVASYVQSEITSGGIIKPGRTVQEDVWQGRAGLVLALGETAFKYTAGGYEWEGPKPEIGSWVIFRFADSWDMHLQGVPCRVVDAENIHAIIDDPEAVY